jgi:hypothetical protein
MQKTQPLYCWEGVLTAPLHNNGSYPIVACVFVVSGMYLPSRCLVMNVYSHFTIPAFGRHVTIYRIATRKFKITTTCWRQKHDFIMDFIYRNMTVANLNGL